MPNIKTIHSIKDTSPLSENVHNQLEIWSYLPFDQAGSTAVTLPPILCRLFLFNQIHLDKLMVNHVW